ncbi:epoxide hydrolase family protein [Micromonospora echinospora]|uniref:epoxide hydrolase family protein n=1 Tax=Micromonospora echinospora TaxID=1877 RepID=UPI0037AE4D72
MSTAPDVRPFRIAVAQEQLDDLRRRLAQVHWPVEPTDVGWSYGVPVDYLRRLVDHWRTGYDWRAVETRLNALPQFTTAILGQPVHFLHVRSPEPTALPLVLSHGWPGSFVEFLDVLGPLADPRAHGADPGDAFHLVVPSLPGFAFSGLSDRVGDGGTEHHAEVVAALLDRLGYPRYGVQGGDAGGFVSAQLGRIAPDRVVGVHLNGPFFFPSWDDDPGEQATWSPADRERLAVLTDPGWERFGYAVMQSTRPQTLAYGMHDSPVALLAWIVDLFQQFTDPARALPEDAVDRDTLLTNVTLYWLTGTFASSVRLYRESAQWGAQPPNSGVPTGCAVFPGDLTVRVLAERQHTIVHWSEFDRGGHFAALEAPDLFVADVRAFFRPLR